MRVSVIGLGKLGLCTAACFAARGHEVIGMDSNRETIAQLAQRRCPVDETGLPALLDQAWERFVPTDDILRAVRETEFTAIIVPTPSTEGGDFTNAYVEDVLRALAPALAEKDHFHVVDVVSTVMPGSSEGRFVPLLESLTGKRCGVDFGLAYNPEFIALGSVIHNFLNPDLVLIGASDERTAQITSQVYEQTCDNTPHIARMSLVNAEITKLSLNCFCTTKISFANELAMLCERTPGADVDVVTAALGRDSRVGAKYLTGGLGFGGPCFPRDNRAFQVFARRVGREARLAPQVVAINQELVNHLFVTITGLVPPGGTVALLGMAYKPDTHVVEESQSIMLARALADAGYQVRVYDPKALESTHDVLGDGVALCQTPASCVEAATLVALLTRWVDFESLDWDHLATLAAPGAVLLDSWRIFKHNRPTGFRYHGLGLGPKER